MTRLPMRVVFALVSEALFALNTNRLRSFLTMLGVVIGVASVVIMLAIGEGSRRSVAASISSLGSNQLIVMSGAASSGGFRGAAGELPTLTIEDANAIAQLPSVGGVAPVSNSQAQIVFGARNKSSSITGSTPAYMQINNMTIAQGSMFNDADVRTAANVGLIGATVLKELFGQNAQPQDAIGQTIRIQRQPVLVVGVWAAKGQGFGGQDQDNIVVVPITTAQRRLAGTLFPGTVSMVLVSAADETKKAIVEQEITSLLRQRHRLATGAENDFSIRDMSSLTQTLTLVSQVLSVLLGSIAFISLLVGGIGIMNIMLVSVTERTREIGVRMALGARRLVIQLQFMTEALILSGVGAIVGLLCGLGVGVLAAKTGAVTVVFTSWSLSLSFGVALIVGIAFGFWPARRASQLNPVEALRYQ
jgi:putative ABC transport system permease protein